MKYLKSCHVPLDLDESKTVKEELKEFQAEVQDGGATLKKLREEKGWTIQELGKKIKTDASFVDEMERGEQPIPLELAKKFGKLFGVDKKLFL